MPEFSFAFSRMQMLELKHIAKLNIKDGARVYAGATQDWYTRKFQKRAGCGPTTCATLLWYLAQTRDGLGALCPYDARTRVGFSQLMEDVWNYVKPGRFGVNRTETFTEGIRRYAADRGVSLACDVMNIPAARRKPGIWALSAFLLHAVEQDRPVAFLNLSAGGVKGLQTWHWVPIIGVDPKTCMVRILDGGRRLDADFALWLRRTARGGGLVSASPINEKNG